MTQTHHVAAPQPSSAAPAADFVAAPGLRRLFVRDLVLLADIGAYRHEHGKPQRVRINLDLMVEEAAATDRLEDVVCYATVVDAVRDLVAQRHTNLVETLAEQIAASCLSDRRVRGVRAQVEKLDALPDATAGIEIQRWSAQE